MTLSDLPANSASPPRYTPDFAEPAKGLVGALLVIGIMASAAGLWRGPDMSDHEVIVAQIAKQSIQTGEWVVPHYLDTPFLVKPPLSPWMAGLSSTLYVKTCALLGATPAALVTSVTARLPSVIATLLTVLIIFRLGVSMFGRPTGFLAAFVYASSLGAMLYAFNATAEALLTLFCTWAFASFWQVINATTRAARTRGLFFFYLAFGLAMLAKGPMPLMMVALPIAVWWWTHNAFEAAGDGGLRSIGRSGRILAAGLWPQLRSALTSLGLWWGVPLFLLVFVPWMLLVADQIPHAWKLWNYEYLDRLKGEYPGTRPGRYHYYLPIVMGLTIPWVLSFPEAVASPFLGRYASERKPLIFAWCWVVVGVLITSMMSFKKPYYIVPVLPGCALLLAPVLREFFFRIRNISPQTMRNLYVAVVSAWAIIGAVMWFVGREMYHEVWHGNMAKWSPFFIVGLTLAVALLGLLYIRGRRFQSLIGLGLTSIVTFVLTWCLIGPSLDNLDDPLALVQKLKVAQVPPDAEIYWAGNRPDGRVVFYGNVRLRQIVDPYKLVSEREEAHDNEDLLIYVGTRIVELLNGARPVYVVFQRDQIEAIRMYFDPDPPMHEIFSIDRGDKGPDEDDWVVISNRTHHASHRPQASVNLLANRR